MRLATLFLLLAASVFSQSIQDRVNKFQDSKSYVVNYDQFQKFHTVDFQVVLSPRKGKSNYKMDMTAVVTINDDKTSDITLYFNPDKKVLYNHDVLRILADDVLIETDESRIAYSAFFTITGPQMDKIIKSRFVKIQLATFEGSFNDDVLKRLANLVTLTKPPY